MSAYNRKVLKKMCSNSGTFDTDSIMDESGYASFKALHNSTVEAPFLFERDSETENYRNATNTNPNSLTTATWRLQNTTFNSMQFQTPSTSIDLSSSLIPAPNTFHPDSEPDTDNEACKSPLPVELSNQQTSLPAHKRRKPHYQLLGHHSSPKKSKKKLFPQPDDLSSTSRTRYYNGYEQLDIIGMLVNTIPALQCILSNVNSQTLDIMTQVSDRWAEAVQKDSRAVERLQNHRCKMNLSKENNIHEHSLKRGHRMLYKSINHHLVPLQPSNAILKPNTQDLGYRSVVNMDDNGHLVEQMQRIKCPRCGKSSKVFYNSQPATEQTPRLNSTFHSKTLPHAYSFSEPKHSLTRFYSLDEVKSNSPDADESMEAGGVAKPYSMGECTSVFCKFRFCVRCYAQPHPGQKCLVTEMGTPSKVMLLPSERITPPKRTQKFDSKLSRKKSLKRLNF